jgi:tRNA nucleotidyltransferase (CCA-adding enzyme)
MDTADMIWLPLAQWANSEQAERIRTIWAEPRLRTAVEILNRTDVCCLLVGGIVRDILLGRVSNDVDLVINCSAARLFELQSYLAQETNGTAVPLDEERGTLRLCFPDGDELDLVSLQGESLLEDLKRRDLTINAISVDPDGALADPFGGRRHLNDRRLATPGESSFRDDPLRVVRCLRFAAQLDFQISPEVWPLMQSATGELSGIAGERLNSELRKFFNSARRTHLEELLKLDLRRELFPEMTWKTPVAQELLFEAAGGGPIGFVVGLALWLGPALRDVDKRKRVFDRLKLSRKVQRFLGSWWDASDWLALKQTLTLVEIFELSKVAASAFEGLAEVLQLDTFPSPLDRDTRQRVLREANRRGEINWEPLPWNGDQIAALVEREPGAWLGGALRRVESAWACGDLRTLEQAREYC